MATKRRKPELVLRNGNPTAVILDIDECQEMFERLDDLEDLKDLKALRAMRKKPLNFRKLDEFLAEYSPRV